MSRERIRIAFFLGYGWHRTILTPVLDELRARGVDASLFEVISDVKEWNPHSTVVADVTFIDLLRKADTPGNFVHICHGLISKNQPELNYSLADYICAPSSFWINEFEARGIRPRKEYWPTGMVQMDPLFRALSKGLTARDSRALEMNLSFRLDIEKPIVLYAPTWNPTLNSVEMIFNNGFEKSFWNNQNVEKFSVLIKPHPHIQKAFPEWIEQWQEIADKKPHQVFIAESDPSHDLYPLILISDLLVSDCSSVIFQFLATGRPQVLINNPQRFDTPLCFDPKGFEWTWRDIGSQVESIDCLPQVLERIFKGSDDRAFIRHARSKTFFGEQTKGNAAYTIAEKIVALHQ